MPKSYAIIGTGAVGGYYGALLARSGKEVHFLARSDAEHIRAQGLRVDSPKGNFRIDPAQVYSNANDLPPCDVTIVALKTTANGLLSDLLPAPTSQNGVVLVLQNGLHPEVDAAAVVGIHRVLGGCCFLCCNKRGPGWIEHLDYGLVAMGEYCPMGENPVGITPRLNELAEDFHQAAIPVQVTNDLGMARWTKLVWNVPFNGLSVVLGTTTDRLMEDAKPLVEELMREVVAGARVCGKELGEEVIERMLDNTRKMVPYKSSMQLDYERGNPLELEAIFGAIIRAVAKVPLRLPRIEMLYQQLQFLQRWGYSRTRASKGSVGHSDPHVSGL